MTKGRRKVLTYLPIIFSVAVLVKALLLLILCPAFISCSENIEPDPEDSGTPADNAAAADILLLRSPLAAGVLDVFCFNDDKLRKLDSYQRITTTEEPDRVEVASGSGGIIMDVIANSPLTPEDCGSVFSYDDILKLHSELVNDNPERPVMTGECRIGPGFGRECRMTLEPILACISVNSICCDFHKRPYKDATLKNVSFYLTNISGRYPFFGPEPEAPAGILNYGGQNQEDIDLFVEPGMIRSGTIPEIGTSVIYPDIRLYCYPNRCPEESLGCPFTRLVIEGELDGEKTWYPININRGLLPAGTSSGYGTSGPERNHTYTYDITITRKGVSDPDIAFSLDGISCSFSVTPWETRPGRTIPY